MFRARDERLKREVAVEVLPAEPSSANAVARFEQGRLEKEPDEPAVLYNVACSYANVGDPAKALDYLEKAATGGWGDPDGMLQDEDLASLHNEPRFQRLIEKLRSRSSSESPASR